MLAQALIAEADAFVAQWKDLKLPDGRDRVVRHGHGPQRTIQTGVGPVKVRRAKVRDRGEGGRGGKNPLQLVDPAEMGAADQGFLDALLPVLYLRGVSTGDFQEALAALLGKDARNLSPAVIARLTAEWQADTTPGVGAISRRGDTFMCGRTGSICSADGGRRRMHARADRRDARGKEGIVGFQTGSRESAQSWRELLIDSTSAGSRSPRTSRSATGRSASGKQSSRSFPTPDIKGVGSIRPRIC